MTPSRREFIRQFGVMLASILATHCASPTATPAPTATAAPTGTSAPASGAPGGGDGPLRERLRECWLGFDWLVQQIRDEIGEKPSDEAGEQAMRQLISSHGVAVGELITGGELGFFAGVHVDAAFEAAVYHVWRSTMPLTCYIILGPGYERDSSAQLTQQVELLAEMAEEGNIDPATVARAQAAIERDIAYLNLSDPAIAALWEELHEAGGGYPPFRALDLDITPEAAEAARFLVELLLEGTE